MGHFFVKHKLDVSRRQCKKVEDFIEEYSLQLWSSVGMGEVDWSDDSESFCLRADFEDMIESIRGMYISKSYLGLYSWLLDRGFEITTSVKCQKKDSRLNKNRSLLLKTLYDINKDNLLNSFKKM
jgi:hypothetical protein